ncbi:hypothetical protein [Roseomonas sp. CECT 9278]|uniref:hypothetical protein n=1 Tax=Roseomonas sp. CECT 9278 TaxID=2845823 RepID=UPI001E3793DF|nr:hypothetical protein [Roseomonas sp. CECT 9278]
MPRSWPLVPIVVLGLGLVMAAAVGHVADPGALWRDPYHDRHSHLASAMTLSLALRLGDPVAFVLELARPTVWPPLQALALGAWMAVVGPGASWAILPSVLGWAVTLVTLAMLAARSCADPSRAALAGGLAVALAATSPAMARLGTDAMMELPGAALTLLVLCAATARPVPWRWLAVLLTLLALHKYNYWIMAVAALLLAATPQILPWARQLLRAVDRRRATEDAPLRLAALALAVAALGLSVDPAWRVGGVLVLPAHVAVLAWGIALLAAARAWRRRGAAFDVALGDPARILLAWHAWPVALWLLVPGKLPALLGFLSPGHAGATAPHGLIDAIAFHWQGFAQGFSPHPAIAAAVLVFAVLGARRAPLALVSFAAIGVLALVLHPQLQWRFQATVLPVVWLLAGLGAAALLPRMAPAVAAALPCLVALLLVALPTPPLADAAAIRRPDAPRDLDLVAAWDDMPVAAGGVLVLASIGRSDLFDWTLRLRCRCLAPVEQPPWLEFGDAPAHIAIGSSAAPVLLAVTMPAPYAVAGRDAPADLPVAAVLAAQSRYVEAVAREAPLHDARVAWWRATRPPAAPPPRRRGLIELAAALLGLATIATLAWPRRAGGTPCASA